MLDRALATLRAQGKGQLVYDANEFFNGAYFKLERVDYDEEYPAPYVYRFTFFPETEAIRRFVDYESEATPAPHKSAIARLFKKE